jgi:hypothetical protein
MWLITIVLFADAWLAGSYGYFLATGALVFTALIASPTSVRIAAVIAAATIAVIITLVELAGVVNADLALVVEFSLCSFWYVYRLVRGPTRVDPKRLG